MTLELARQSIGNAEEAGLPGSSARMNSQLIPSFAKVPVTLQVVLGSARIPLSEMLSLQSGSTITLDQKLGAPVSVVVNGCAVAQGQLIVLDEQTMKLGVKIVEISNAQVTA